MNNRAKPITAVLAAAALCLGSFTVASATLKPAALSATQAISACADGTGHLRLATRSNTCASGTTSIGLARSSIAPQALALYSTSGPELSKTLSLIANTQLVAHCYPTDEGEQLTELEVVHNGPTQIDGTAFVVENESDGVQFFRIGGGSNVSPTGASSVYSAREGGFAAAAGDSADYATVNVHLLVTVPGAVFTIDAVVDANGATPYCRVSAEVSSAASG
jgi:hypothetical protein